MKLIDKIAATIEMSFDVPEIEQQEAKQSIEAFKQVINAMKYAEEHLNIIYVPFKKAQNLSPESVWEFRGAIRTYKEQIKKNYSEEKIDSSKNGVKKYAFDALSLFNNFSSDTHVIELINSFKDAVGDIEKQVNILLDILDNMKDPSFKDNVISCIDEIRKQSFEVEKLINDRIIDFINSNIITSDWVANTSQNIKQEIKKKEPYITQLYKERLKALEQTGK